MSDMLWTNTVLLLRGSNVKYFVLDPLLQRDCLAKDNSERSEEQIGVGNVRHTDHEKHV